MASISEVSISNPAPQIYGQFAVLFSGTDHQSEQDLEKPVLIILAMFQQKFVFFDSHLFKIKKFSVTVKSRAQSFSCF
jgi:hypothetical protein